MKKLRKEIEKREEYNMIDIKFQDLILSHVDDSVFGKSVVDKVNNKITADVVIFDRPILRYDNDNEYHIYISATDLVLDTLHNISLINHSGYNVECKQMTFILSDTKLSVSIIFTDEVFDNLLDTNVLLSTECHLVNRMGYIRDEKLEKLLR